MEREVTGQRGERRPQALLGELAWMQAPRQPSQVFLGAGELDLGPGDALGRGRPGGAG